MLSQVLHLYSTPFCRHKMRAIEEVKQEKNRDDKTKMYQCMKCGKTQIRYQSEE